MAGISETGFTRLRLEDIKSDLEALFTEAYGDVSLEADSVIGLLIGIMAHRLATLWEELENVYYTQYPASAEGFSLDNVAALSAITRLAADNTEVLVAIWGNDATDVSIGFQGSIEVTGELFSLVENVTLSKDAAAGAAIEIISVLTETYTITINGNAYNYANSQGDPDVIAAALAASIEAGEADVTATSDGPVVDLVSTDGETEFTVGSLDVTHFDLNEMASFGNFEADETGTILAPAETLIVIETPVSGVNSIINYNDGSPLGRDVETDTELRIRRLSSLALIGTCTIAMIRASLLENVDNVTAVRIDENRTDVPVSGLPAHSFECFVQGGDPQQIGEHIWSLKPAGIESHGDIQILITDSQGEEQSVYFSRPIEVLIWIEINMTENIEEGFPANGEAAVEEAVLAAGQELSVAEDVIIQKLIAAIYNAVQGIATATITWETSAGPYSPPLTQTGNITIATGELATFHLDRIWATMT